METTTNRPDHPTAWTGFNRFGETFQDWMADVDDHLAVFGVAVRPAFNYRADWESNKTTAACAARVLLGK